MEEENAKAAKRNLVHAINRAKEDVWKNLCDLVEKDPWGLPYKLVMGKLSRPPPIPELSLPGRTEHIVQGLFPQHPRRHSETWPESPVDSQTHREIDIAELKVVASSLKKKISPGKDGILNEAVKAIDII